MAKSGSAASAYAPDTTTPSVAIRLLDMQLQAWSMALNWACYGSAAAGAGSVAPVPIVAPFCRIPKLFSRGQTPAIVTIGGGVRGSRYPLLPRARLIGRFQALLDRQPLWCLVRSRGGALCPKQKNRLARRFLRNPIRCFDQTAAITADALRFMPQPSRPITPRPVAKSGRVAGMGVAESPFIIVTGPAVTVP